jgi:hypothetical protein
MTLDSMKQRYCQPTVPKATTTPASLALRGLSTLLILAGMSKGLGFDV